MINVKCFIYAFFSFNLFLFYGIVSLFTLCTFLIIGGMREPHQQLNRTTLPEQTRPTASVPQPPPAPPAPAAPPPPAGVPPPPGPPPASKCLIFLRCQSPSFDDCSMQIIVICLILETGCANQFCSGMVCEPNTHPSICVQ